MAKSHQKQFSGITVNEISLIFRCYIRPLDFGDATEKQQPQHRLAVCQIFDVWVLLIRNLQQPTNSKKISEDSFFIK